jgi:Periplasmic binding protein
LSRPGRTGDTCQTGSHRRAHGGGDRAGFHHRGRDRFGAEHGARGHEHRDQGFGTRIRGVLQGGEAAKARFDQANTSGEVPGGRKINYIGLADDQSSADIDTQKGRALVDQDGIFAAVPVITPLLQAAGYFEQQKVPVLGLGISSAFCDASITYAFGFTGCQVPNPPKYVGNTWGELISEQLKGQGKGGAAGKTAAVIADNNDSGKADMQRSWQRTCSSRSSPR